MKSEAELMIEYWQNQAENLANDADQRILCWKQVINHQANALKAAQERIGGLERDLALLLKQHPIQTIRQLEAELEQLRAERDAAQKRLNIPAN